MNAVGRRYRQQVGELTVRVGARLVVVVTVHVTAASGVGIRQVSEQDVAGRLY